MLVTDLVHSLLDYCNVFLAELPLCDITSNDCSIVFDSIFSRYKPVVISAYSYQPEANDSNYSLLFI